MAITDESARPRARTEPPLPPSPAARNRGVTLGVLGALAALVLASLLTPLVVAQDAMWIAVLSGALLAVAAVPGRAAGWVAGALVGGWVLIQGLYLASKQVSFGLPVDRAVGGGAYFDTPYVPSQAASGLALVAALLVATLVTRRFGAIPATAPALPTARRRRPEIIVAAATALIAGSVQPDLWTRLRPDALVPLPPSWDGGNLLAWESFAERGLQPVKDFFYPYGHLLAFSATPWGPMWLWFAHCALLAAAAWCFWRLSDRSVGHTVVAVLAMAILLIGWTVLDRYLPAMLMGLAYAAVGPLRHRRPTPGHLLVGIMAVYTTWIEPDVLLMGLAAIGCVLLGELVAGRARLPLGELARRVAVDLAPLALLVLIPLIWIAEGTWEQNTRYWLALRATSAASSRDEVNFGALTGQSLIPGGATVAVFTPLLVMICGLVLGRVRAPRAHAASMVLLAGAGVCELMLLKHLVRPVALYVLILGIVSFVFAAILLWSRRNAWLAGVVGLFMGAVFVTVQQERMLSLYVTNAAYAPTRFARNAKLPTQYAAVARAEYARFAPERFSNWGDALMAEDLRQAMQFSDEKTWSLVGDSPMLYTVLRARPPYHTELYDASRIEEQQLFVDDLARRRPKFIAFRFDQIEDGIPQAARSPLIFAYMVRNYIPIIRGAYADILVRRDDRPFATTYWHSKLDTLFLANLPAHSGAASAARCDSGADCARYAMLKGHASRNGQQVVLRVTGPKGGPFSVVLTVKPGVDTYPVRLDRLWFSGIVGPDPRVEVQTPGGWTVGVEGRRTGDALY